MTCAVSTDYKHFTMGHLARAMGLELLEGDPAKLTTQPYGCSYRFKGAPHGRRVSFELTSSVSFSGRGRLAVELAAPVPRFEVCTASRPLQSLLPRLDTPLPQIPFGHPTVDASWVLRTRDARVGPVIARVMSLFPQTLAARLVCTGEWLQLRSADAGALAVVDGERLLFALEELSRALEGRALLSTPPGEWQDAISMRCAHCGAPAHEVPAGIHEPIDMRCDHCDARMPAPDELAPAIRALRAAASHKRWSERDRAMFARADRSGAALKDSVGAMQLVFVGAAGVWLAAAGAFHLGVLILPGNHGIALGAALALVTMAIVGVLVLIAFSIHRRIVRDRAAMRAAMDEPEVREDRALDFECSGCGGTVALMQSAVARCAYCGGASVAEADDLRAAGKRLRREGDLASARSGVLYDRLWSRWTKD